MDVDEPYVILPLHEIYVLLVLSTLLHSLLAVYMDQVVPNAFGRAEKPLFLFDPAYWGGGKLRRVDTTTDETDEGESVDSDVQAEQERTAAPENMSTRRGTPR